MEKTLKQTNITYSKAVDIKRLKFITDTINKANVSANPTILDIGCGNGLMSLQLGKLGYSVKGIDISAEAIAKANENNCFPNVSFEIIDAEKLAAKSEKYDFIICSEVLEHLYEPESMVANIKQILKANGKLIVTVPNGLGPREVFITKPMQWMEKNAKTTWNIIGFFKSKIGYDGKTEQSAAADLTHVHFFTKKALINLIAARDFELVEFKKANFLADVFPFSALAKKSLRLQRLDCQLADMLPHQFTCGFNTLWEMKKNN